MNGHDLELANKFEGKLLISIQGLPRREIFLKEFIWKCFYIVMANVGRKSVMRLPGRRAADDPNDWKKPIPNLLTYTCAISIIRYTSSQGEVSFLKTRYMTRPVIRIYPY
jgi:hypothetical protein